MTEQQNFYPECQRHLLDLPQLPKTVQTQEVNTYAKHQVPPPTPPSTVGTMDPIPYETPAPSQEYQLQQQQEPLNLIHDFFASTVHHLADPSTPYLATSFDIQRFLESRFQSHFSTCSSATTTPTPAFAGSTVAAAPGSTAAAAATAAQTDAPLPAPAPAPSSTPHQFDFQITTCLQILFEVLIHKLETTDCIEITNTDATARFVEWTGENLFPLLQCYIGAADGAFELVALEVLLWTCLPLRRTIDGGLVNLGPVSSARMELFAPVLICLRKCGVVREGVVERWIEGVREKVAVAEEGERVVGGGGGGGSNGGSMFVGVADVLYKYERLASISEFLAFDGYDFDYAGVSAAPSPQNAAPPFVCWNGMVMPSPSPAPIRPRSNANHSHNNNKQRNNDETPHRTSFFMPSNNKKPRRFSLSSLGFGGGAGDGGGGGGGGGGGDVKTDVCGGGGGRNTGVLGISNSTLFRRKSFAKVGNRVMGLKFW